MTLCELEIARLSPPMECQPVKPRTTPMKRHNCVEWVSFPISSARCPSNHELRALARSAQSWSSYSGYFRESSEPGCTCPHDCTADNPLSSHVLRLPATERYRYVVYRLHEGRLRRAYMHRCRKGHLPKYHGGENALGPVPTRPGTKFSTE